MEFGYNDLESAIQKNLLYDFSSDEDMDVDEDEYNTSEIDVEDEYEELSDENINFDAEEDNKEDENCHRGENSTKYYLALHDQYDSHCMLPNSLHATEQSGSTKFHSSQPQCKIYVFFTIVFYL